MVELKLEQCQGKEGGGGGENVLEREREIEKERERITERSSGTEFSVTDKEEEIMCFSCRKIKLLTIKMKDA